MERVGKEHGVPGEEVLDGDGIEDEAGIVKEAGAGVERDKLGAKKIVGCDREEDEAAVELPSTTVEAAVGEVLNEVTEGENVRGGKGVRDAQLGAGQK